jgi:hypothetical protein
MVVVGSMVCSFAMMAMIDVNLPHDEHRCALKGDKKSFLQLWPFFSFPH